MNGSGTTAFVREKTALDAVGGASPAATPGRTFLDSLIVVIGVSDAKSVSFDVPLSEFEFRLAIETCPCSGR